MASGARRRFPWRIMLFALLIVVSFAAFVSGIGVMGRGAAAIACQNLQPVPSADRTLPDNTRISGERTFFPLGGVCTYEVPNDGLGTQTVSHANWPATIVWLLSAVAAIWVVARSQSTRRRRSAP